jgi:hypothetical protein
MITTFTRSMKYRIDDWREEARRQAKAVCTMCNP